MADITMPQLGETVTEGTVTRWLKGVGDQIAEDEVLFEVSTDKVDSEVPSPAAGYLAEILVQEGETVDVGAKLAVVTSEPPAGGGGAQGGQAQAAPEAQAAPQDQTPPEPQPQAAEPEPAPQPQARPEPQPQAEPAPVSAAQPSSAPAPQAAPAEQQPAPATNGSGGDGTNQVLSPVVRRLLSEHDLDPSQIQGTGSGGRITRADVLALVDQRSGAVATPSAPQAPPQAPPAPQPQPAPAQAPPPAQPQPSPPAQAQPAPAPQQAPPAGLPAQQAPGSALVRTSVSGAPPVPVGARDEVVPFTNIRRRTAEHMTRSKATSAHTLTAIEVDYEGIDVVRRAAKERFRAEEGIGLTYLPFVARAVADAIRDFPHLNSSVGDESLVVHHDLHLGIAVDLGDEGLIVPVIHDAGDKRLRLLARDMAELAHRARSRKLTADDIAGGTFTITNPGPFGTFMTVPIINQPQVAILSTDGVKRRPVVITMPDGSEGIAIHSTGILALSFDHRAVDGAYASRFLARLKEIVETRDWSQEL